MKKKNLIYLILIILIIAGIFYKKTKDENTITINIGYQSVTSQTWGALIMKEQKIFEKKLQEKFPDKNIKVIWHDEISGAVINTAMISNKMQFGFMGDMPLLLNMHKASTNEEYDSKLIAFDGKGILGQNQSIVISSNSKIENIKDLEGKTISTPIGSSAHFMLMKILEKHNLLNKVEIVHQDVAQASQLLSTNKTDAFSIWDPYPLFLKSKINAKILVDGKESEIDYLAGIMVNNNWAKENQEIVKLFIESLNEAHEYIKNNKEEAAKIFSKESGFEYEITIQEANNISWESEILEKDINTLEEKKKFLINLDQISEFSLNQYIYQ